MCDTIDLWICWGLLYLALAEHVQPVTLVQLLDGLIECGLPDTVSPKRFYYLAAAKESREDTLDL